MAGTFDHEDKASWYFGSMSRQEATDLLMAEKEGGVFLVRDSSTSVGDFVLCVREDSKVSHYIINKMQSNEQVRYRIGDQIFPTLQSLLAFYKFHYLDTTFLIRPAPKRIQQVVAKYDFEGADPDDLPFKKGEILTVVSKDEEQWWTAKNSSGAKGSIPVPYVQKIDNSQSFAEPSRPGSDSISSIQSDVTLRRNQIQRKLPAMARVKQIRIPNAYDETALKLEVGDLIRVTKTNINGQWEGELNGKVGHFPFTHVEFLDSEKMEKGQLLKESSTSVSVLQELHMRSNMLDLTEHQLLTNLTAVRVNHLLLSPPSFKTNKSEIMNNSRNCCNPEVSSEGHEYYTPGFEINYPSRTTSSSSIKNNERKLTGEEIAERCRISYAGKGNMIAIEGHSNKRPNRPKQ